MPLHRLYIEISFSAELHDVSRATDPQSDEEEVFFGRQATSFSSIVEETVCMVSFSHFVSFVIINLSNLHRLFLANQIALYYILLKEPQRPNVARDRETSLGNHPPGDMSSESDGQLPDLEIPRSTRNRLRLPRPRPQRQMAPYVDVITIDSDSADFEEEQEETSQALADMAMETGGGGSNRQ